MINAVMIKKNDNNDNGNCNAMLFNIIEVRFALKGRNTGDIRPSYHEKLGI